MPNKPKQISLRPPAAGITLAERISYQWLRRPFKLQYHDLGGPSPDAPVIILLHGIASSSANWLPLIPLLSPQYRCITIDLLGFGASPKPQWADYSMQQHVRALEHTIGSLKLNRPFILAGHSLGGLLATRYARQHGTKIERLILLSPPVYGPPNDITNRNARQRTSLYLKAYRFIATHKRATYDNFQKLSRILPLAKFLILDNATWRPFVRSLTQCIENQTLLADIKHVAAPTDIFYGQFDEVVVPYNVRQIASLRDVQLHALRVNHTVGKRYAAAVAKVLLDNDEASDQISVRHTEQ